MELSHWLCVCVCQYIWPPSGGRLNRYAQWCFMNFGKQNNKPSDDFRRRQNAEPLRHPRLFNRCPSVDRRPLISGCSCSVLITFPFKSRSVFTHRSGASLHETTRAGRSDDADVRNGIFMRSYLRVADVEYRTPEEASLKLHVCVGRSRTDDCHFKRRWNQMFNPSPGGGGQVLAGGQMCVCV